MQSFGMQHWRYHGFDFGRAVNKWEEKIICQRTTVIFFKVKNDWSLIKDKLLGCYLMPYFQKVLATGKTICYVDCFSGKGQFEDGNPGSPIIALQSRDKCLQKTKMRIDKSKAIETTFIDLNYAADLRTNLASYSNYYGIPNIVSGKYEEKIIDILKNKKGQNVFCI